MARCSKANSRMVSMSNRNEFEAFQFKKIDLKDGKIVNQSIMFKKTVKRKTEIMGV